MEKNKNNYMSLIGFIVSLISTIINPLCTISILGFAFSFVGYNSGKNKGLAVAGIVLSSIAFVYNATILVLALLSI